MDNKSEEQKSVKDQTSKHPSARNICDNIPSHLNSLLDGLKKVESGAGNYFERYKALDMMQDSLELIPVINMSKLDANGLESTEKKKKLKRNMIKIKTIETLIKYFRDEDFQIHQVEKLLNLIIKTEIAIHYDKESRILSTRSHECVKNILDRLIVDGKLPSSYIRHIFKIINDHYYWQLKDDCINLIVTMCEKSKSRSQCLLFILENMHTDYEYLSHVADILQVLILNYQPRDVEEISKQLVERCCQLLAECDPKKTEAKNALEGCLATLVSSNEEKILPSIAIQSVRVSIGIYRSDIADLLYKLCKDREICELRTLVGPLMLMLDDRDADVVIRGYHLFTQVLSPSIAYLYQMHSTDNFLSYAGKIGNEIQSIVPPATIELIKSRIKQIILSMLICYIRHAIYPKTLEAVLTFNCTIIIEVKDPLFLSRIASFLLNLQEAALSILPIKSMRQSFMQWAVTHLFLLVADVYNISSLNEYIYGIIEQRRVLAPFLITPITPASVDSIPPPCLVEKQQVNIIIDNWNELIEPTRTVHKVHQSSALSIISAWEEIDSQL